MSEDETQRRQHDGHVCPDLGPLGQPRTEELCMYVAPVSLCPISFLYFLPWLQSSRCSCNVLQIELLLLTLLGVLLCLLPTYISWHSLVARVWSRRSSFNQNRSSVWGQVCKDRCALLQYHHSTCNAPAIAWGAYRTVLFCSVLFTLKTKRPLHLPCKR